MSNDRINRGKRLEWSYTDVSEKKKNIVNISILYYNYNYYNIIIVYFHFIEDKEYSKWHVQDIRTSHKDLALRKRSRREKSICEYLWCNDYKE